MILFHSYVSAGGMRKQGMSYAAAGKKAVGTMSAHVKYLQHRPGDDREKGGRKFYDESGCEIDSAIIRKEIRELGPRGVVIHKILLAPDVNPRDSLDFAREVMREIGAEKGQDLTWRMVVHKNTDNHHVNIICYGKDKKGRQVRFSKQDHQKMRAFGDRWLDRNHPLERELKAQQREERKQNAHREKEMQRAFERDQYRKGMQAYYKRHYIDPWKYDALYSIYYGLPGQKKDDGPQKVTVDGVTYDKNSSLEDLRRVDQYLWSWDTRLPREDAAALRKWLFIQERIDARRRQRGLDAIDARNYDPEKSARLVFMQQMNDLHRNQRYGTRGDPVGGRYVDPLQEAATHNKAFSIFMKMATLANDFVKSIPLLDTRDFYKMSQDELDDRLREFHEVWKRFKGTAHQTGIEDIIESIHRAKDVLAENREKQMKERKRSRQLDDPELDLMG